jgi:ADP-ribose pyrophosphatase
MKVDVIREETPFKEFFHVRKARLRFERFDGSMSPEVTRYSFSKWDAVAALVYHVTAECYILVRQMRYPPTHHDVDPWMTEIVAGGITPGEDEAYAAEREIIEEIGYKPKRMERIMRFYVSPGIMSERITLFYAEVDETSRLNNGGGLLHEDEDIELIRVPRRDALHWLSQQVIGDAKTIAAMLWDVSRRRA